MALKICQRNKKKKIENLLKFHNPSQFIFWPSGDPCGYMDTRKSYQGDSG